MAVCRSFCPAPCYTFLIWRNPSVEVLPEMLLAFFYIVFEAFQSWETVSESIMSRWETPIMYAFDPEFGASMDSVDAPMLSARTRKAWALDMRIALTRMYSCELSVAIGKSGKTLEGGLGKKK